MHIFEIKDLCFKSLEFRSKNCIILFVYIFSITFFKDCASSAISFKTFVFNRVSNKSTEKQLINNNYII